MAYINNRSLQIFILQSSRISHSCVFEVSFLTSLGTTHHLNFYIHFCRILCIWYVYHLDNHTKLNATVFYNYFRKKLQSSRPCTNCISVHTPTFKLIYRSLVPSVYDIPSSLWTFLNFLLMHDTRLNLRIELLQEFGCQ